MVGFWVNLWKTKSTRYYLAEMEQLIIAAVVVMKSASLAGRYRALFIICFYLEEEDESKFEDCFRL